METDFQEGFEVVGEDGWVEFLDSGAVKLDDVVDSGKIQSVRILGRPGGCHQGCGGKVCIGWRKGRYRRLGEVE